MISKELAALEESILNTPVLRELRDQKAIKVYAETLYVNITRDAIKLRPQVSPLPAKNIIETMDLFRQAILDYQERENKTQDARIDVSYEDPDSEQQKELITISLARREPGQWGKGAPWTSTIRNRKPLFREEYNDPDYPGYKRGVLGFIYDNTVRLKCWARTNRAANDRSIWLESLMFEYGWFLEASGVQRFLYEGRQADETKIVNGNPYFARVIDYFVRTEKLFNVSQKTLEELCLKVAVAQRT
jgi:hypothetical protein